MFKNFIFIMTLMLLVTTSLYAQDLSFGPQVGYLKAKDADDGVFMVGAALRARLIKSLPERMVWL